MHQFCCSPSMHSLVLAACLGCASVASAADRALLIGIDDYAGDISPLWGAVNDIDAMARLLSERFGVAPESILRLHDEEATRGAILAAFDHWLIEGTGPGDRVFFHYSGHGYFQKDTDGDESGPGGDGYDEVLVPVDVTCGEDGCRNFIIDDELGARFDRLAGRSVFAVVDACHAGTATRGGLQAPVGQTRLMRRDPRADAPRSRGLKGADPGDPGLLSDGPQMVALSAVASFQEAPEDVDASNRPVGFLTNRLVRALDDGAADQSGDGKVSFAELLGYLRAQGEAFCQERPRHRSCINGVTPQLSIPAEWMGDEVLRLGSRGDEPAAPTTAQQAAEHRLSGDDVANLLSGANPANLQLRVRPGNELREGDRMQLEIRADRPGLLVLLDLDADGKLTQLYPNNDRVDPDVRPDGRPQGWIRAGSPVLIPDAYSGVVWPVGPPYGSGRIVAILAEDETDVAERVPASRAFQAVARPAAWLGELGIALNQMIRTEETFARPARWSVTMTDYRVLP